MLAFKVRPMRLPLSLTPIKPFLTPPLPKAQPTKQFWMPPPLKPPLTLQFLTQPSPQPANSSTEPVLERTLLSQSEPPVRS
jgi:hypothetical protein